MILVGLLIFAGGCSNNQNSDSRESAFGKENIQKAITAEKLQHVYYDGKVLKAKDGLAFQRAKITLPNGTVAEGLRLRGNDGEFVLNLFGRLLAGSWIKSAEYERSMNLMGSQISTIYSFNSTSVLKT